MTKKCNSKQSIENNDQHVDNEKFKEKNHKIFENFHLIAQGEYQKSNPTLNNHREKENF